MTAGETLTAAGYVVGAAVYLWSSSGWMDRRLGLWLLGVGLAAGIVGAKLGQLAFSGLPLNWQTLVGGGRAWIPGLLAGWLAVEAVKRAWGVRGSTGDAFALALCAGEAVGRIGCFLNPCCVGTPTAVPWAVFQQGAWRHPVQLYSAAFLALLFLFLLRARQAWTGLEGRLFAAYLGLWGLGRFVLEFWRQREVVGGFSVAQWLGLELAVAGAVVLVLASRGGSAQRGLA